MKKVLLLASLFLLAVFFSAYAQEKTISGKIIDGDGNPIPAATIVISGTTNGTTANAEGQFSLKAKVGDQLEVSSVGFGKKTITVTDSNSPLTITLKSSAHSFR